MSKMYMFYKVKWQGNTVAQFAGSNLAVHFVNSIPGEDFIINYENRKDVWDTSKEGTPIQRIIDERVSKFNEEQENKFNEKMAKYQMVAQG
jgi:hypothetical protein